MPLCPASRVARRHASGSVLALAALLGAAPPAAAQIQATFVASGFDRPVAFVQNPADPAMQLIAEQPGRVRVLLNGVVQAQDYLDLTAVTEAFGEQGLLGFAFAPDYAASGRVFACFTNLAGHTVIARFVRSAVDPLRADPATRFDLIWPGGEAFIVQPFGNHNGGHLAFGPDGYLYIGMGDGGSGNDPFHLAQNPLSLLGKMLRIDVDVPDTDPEGYDVPAGNPYVGIPDVLDEIWSFGLRNPWRWSFDDPTLGGTGALVIGDVGQSAWEEIDYEPAGAGGRNYGWRNREGAHDNVTSLPPFSLPLIDPIHEYPREVGTTVIGGVVYRGSALGAAFYGRYFFADIGSGRLWSLGLNLHPVTGEATVADIQEHTAAPGAGVRPWVSFGTNVGGEIFGLTYDGVLLRLDPEPGGSGPGAPIDFDGDGASDVAVFRPSTGTWFILQSGGGHQTSAVHAWGMSGDVPVPGDYDGDGVTDLAVYRPASGFWFILRSSSGFTSGSFHSWGAPGDIPVPGDYDGDGRTDIAVFRPSEGRWYILASSSAFTRLLFYSWGADGDIPVPADYDGDGQDDLALYRPSTGTWFVLTSASAYTAAFARVWGQAGDVPLTGDYDGDGAADFAIYRPSTGQWFILRSGGFGAFLFVAWGVAGDEPVPADYDGDGRTDIAMYRPSTGGWFILTSNSSFTAARVHFWGIAGDIPVVRRP